MRQILTLLIFFLSFTICNSQTILTPIVGFEISRMKVKEIEYGYDSRTVYSKDSGFKNGNLVIGLKLEHRLFNSLYLSYQFNYTKKQTLIYEAGCFSMAEVVIKMPTYRNSLSIQYVVSNGLYFGGGFNYSTIKNGTVSYFEANKSTFNESGFHLAGGFKYSHFDLGISYYKGLTSNKILDLEFEPINSILLTLGYNINAVKILHLVGMKNMNCPRF